MIVYGGLAFNRLMPKHAQFYNEDIDSSLTETTKKIDLSSFPTGVYVFNLTNDQGTSTYKVLLDK